MYEKNCKKLLLIMARIYQIKSSNVIVCIYAGRSCHACSEYFKSDRGHKGIFLKMYPHVLHVKFLEFLTLEVNGQLHVMPAFTVEKHLNGAVLKKKKKQK